MKAPAGFFLCSSGDLVRATGPADVVRPNYSRTHSRIKTGLQFRATLRAGPYAWPGGYQMYLHTSDCDTMCFACGLAEFKQIARAIRDKDDSGWRVVGCDINYEDADMQCCHCGASVPSAYGNDESENAE